VVSKEARFQIVAAHDLKQSAREIFADALRGLDAGRAVREAVQLDGAQLGIVDQKFALASRSRIYSIAIGKAAHAMASALRDALGARLTRGVVSAPQTSEPLPAQWQVFAGGHPLPNEASLAAGRAARALLSAADAPDALVIFLISGGGSAMLEWPRGRSVTLADLRTTNRVLVTCGAPIAEVNAVRRVLSAIKGGGLSALAPHATQVSLIISDTNPGALAQVASGPTFASTGQAPREIADILERYHLRQQLPASVLRALDDARTDEAHNSAGQNADGLQRHYLLLDNERAQALAAEAARARGFAVEICDGLIEAPVEVGCRELVARLLQLRRERTDERVVCLVGGGEFVCPVRGDGTGGRNAEAALRSAVEFAAHAEEIKRAGWRVAALHAGTDGVDGNSPAAGAVADETTIRRARECGLDAADFLARSDAYNFFRALGDAIETGPTGTNVRDLRILLAV
jgi:glycerate 2-kinase